jgi:hypothetical protein
MFLKGEQDIPKQEDGHVQRISKGEQEIPKQEDEHV